eukprot:CAMPEP_0197478282 /NCGR_PEP_ID=MMETSP1309-20131121/24904_1 /TAXON_ID=464262 /ORGANISM="Genus nov. species nov., Strain RCC998" /LENGTH=376 /DNA_ID=CAMNT_0043019629 /DNA_START=29 /DNA_END=1159 /DNA_ORIENTATION=-
MWADDEPVDEAPRSEGPPAQRFGNAQDDVYKSAPAYTQYSPSSQRRERGDRDSYRDHHNDRDRGHGGSYRDNRGYRDSGGFRERPSLPVPEKPPYTACVFNVPYELQTPDVEAFFVDCGAIEDIRISKGRNNKAKCCFVEFGERESLIQALNKTGSYLGGRPVRVNVAEARTGWNSGGMDRKSYRDRPSYNSGGNQPSGDSSTEFTEASPSSLAERPKLNLKPRSVPVGGGAAANGKDSSNSSNIFGAARPVDSSKKLQEVESKINEEKEKIKKEIESTKEEEEGSESQTPGGSYKAKRTGGGGGFRNSYQKKNERGYENFSNPRGRSSSSGGGDSGGFTQPKHVQRLAKETGDGDKEEKKIETSLNAFSLLDVDD